jgi:hypothetical protein
MSKTVCRADRMRAGWSRADDGAAAVEFALVSLLLVTLLLGIIEFSLLLRDNVAVSSAVRTGARIASAEAGDGPATCLTMPPPASTPPCSPSTAPKLAQDAADAVQRAGSAMPKSNIDELWIYKANLSGFPGSATSLASASCTSGTSCVKFIWVDANNRFQYASGGWASTSIAACVGSSDAVGVIMKGTHKYLFGMFGTTQAMADRAVMQFEPLPTDSCQANKGIGAGGHA